MNSTTPPCIFCTFPKFETRIITHGEHNWILASDGQINEGYALLIPKRHVPCLGEMSSNELEQLHCEIKKIRSALQHEFPDEPAIMFEHGIVGQTIQHAHMHWIPGIGKLTEKVIAQLVKSTSHVNQGVISALPELANVYSKKKQELGKQPTYLLIQDPGSNQIDIIWNPCIPPQYLRILSAESIGRPERANWRNMDPEFDTSLRLSTINRMRPHLEKVLV